jgi:hypothetical protein
MKVAVCADVHIGNHKRFGGPTTSGINRRCRHVLDAFEAAMVEADMFDDDHPSPQIVAEVQQILNRRTVHAFLLVGNHDQHSDQAGDNALGPLADYATVVESPVRIPDTGILCLPYRRPHTREWLEDELTQWEGVQTVMLHVGIEDSGTPSYLRGQGLDVDHLARLMNAHKIRNAFSGDWHNYELWQKPLANIVQCGALAPTGWDNPGLAGYGYVHIFDTRYGGVPDKVTIPGPRFVTLNGFDPSEAVRVRAPAHRVYARVKVPQKDADKAMLFLEDLKKAGHIVDGYVDVDSADVGKLATQAVAAVRGSEDWGAAVEKFVDGIVLPDGVSRSAVMKKSSEYLGRRAG